MKKIIIAMAAIAAALSMASCVKEQIVEPEENPVVVTGDYVITASTESSLTKTSLSGSDSEGYEVIWSKGDQIKIGEEAFTLTEGEETTKGTFQGTLPEDGTYTACYPATYNGTDWPATQTYVEGNISGSPMTAETTVSGGEVSESLQFKNAGGILRLTVKGTATVKSIIVSAEDLGDITLYCGEGVGLNATNGTVFHIAMPTGTYTGTSILFTTTDGKYCTKALKKGTSLSIERSKITLASFKVDNFQSIAPDGALPETFTVSADGKKVFFSWGNLYYDGTDFGFSPDQLSLESGSLSHFYWSNMADQACAESYNQHLFESDDDILFTNADFETPNPNFIANGQKGLWRALSEAEWSYLVSNSSVWATIKGVNGLVIFCDGYTGSKTGPFSEIPEGCAFLPAAGHREKDSFDVSKSGEEGYYWTSEPYKYIDDYCAFFLLIDPADIMTGIIKRSEAGYCARLVTDVNGNLTPTLTVTFDTNGHGTAPADITKVQYRSKISKPADPVASGYAFCGWYKEANCIVPWNFDADEVTANTTLYAKWFNIPSGALPGMFEVNENGKKVMFSKGNLYWDGDSFEFESSQTGYSSTWNTSHVSHFFWSKDATIARQATYNDPYATVNDAFFANGANYTPNPEFTVNGQKGIWSLPPEKEWKYLIAHYPNKYSEINGIGGLVIAPAGHEIRDSYTTSQWAAAESEGYVFMPCAGFRWGNPEIDVPGDIGNYWFGATYEADRACRFHFYLGYVDPDYTNGRWYGNSVRLVASTSVAPVPPYTVKFENSRGAAPADITGVQYNALIDAPADPVSPDPDWIFYGWGLNKDGGEVWDFSKDRVTEDMTLHAIWAFTGAVPGRFTVDANGKQVFFSRGILYCNGDTNTFDFEKDQLVSPRLWEHSHMTTFFWSGKASVACDNQFDYSTALREGDVLFTNATENTANSTFTVNGHTGIWRSLSAEEWDYLIKNNTVYAQINGVEGRIIFCDGYDGPRTDLAAIPEGCAFMPIYGLAWWTSSGENARVSQVIMLDKQNTVLSLAAIDQRHAIRLVMDVSAIPTPTYTVHLDMGGIIPDSSINKVGYHSILTKPADPKANGYTFDGWYKDKAFKNAWNFTTERVNSDMTLYAKWHPTDGIDAKFTVNSSGKQVIFSKGNLWCDTASNPGPSNFHFEANQYESAPAPRGNGSYGTRDDSHISHFLWSRSAAEAVKLDYEDVNVSVDDILFTNDPGFTVNGLGGWCSLSEDEMTYLLHTRSGSTVGSTGNARYFNGKIQTGTDTYVNGFFIIPDVFTWPQSAVATLPVGINGSASFNSNTYSLTQFAALQEAGIVFLPTAGMRMGSKTDSPASVKSLNENCMYWSSTSDSSDAGKARCLGAGGVVTPTLFLYEKYYGFPIRLVMDVKANTSK